MFSCPPLRSSRCPGAPIPAARRRSHDDDDEGTSGESDGEGASDDEDDAGPGDSATRTALAPLLNRLSSVSVDAISLGGDAPELPALPGLQIDGAIVPLPLDGANGERWYAAGAPSPHGQGYNTVVDPAVRSSREFNAVCVRVPVE